MINTSHLFKSTLVVFALSTAISPAAFAKKPKESPVPEATKKVKTPSDYLAESWNHYIYLPFLDQIADIPRIPAASTADQVKCDQMYAKVKAKGEMKIIMGIGYYDFSEGEPFNFDYRPDGSMSIVHHEFGMNATIDLTYTEMYRQILTRRCSGNLQLCGFNQDAPGIYSKTVQAPDGQKIRAVIETRDSSVTPSHADNVGSLLEQQTAKSAAATKWFFDGVSTSDLVVYNGHSRKGGGPDFNPPRLLKTLHVNYDWYARHEPGLTNLLNALNSSSAKPAGLLMMSCNSNLLFAKRVAKASPQTAFAGTNAVIPGDIPNKGAMAGMDSFLKFQCQEGFTREMQSEQTLQEQLKPLTLN